MSARTPALLLAGDPRNGVALFARQLAGAVGRAQPVTRVTTALDPGEPAHLHFTERLWGPAPEHAAARVAALARGRRLTVTLHDIPQDSDGRGLARRVAAYGAVVRVAAAIAVSSEHERELLRALGATTPRTPVTVIPLPVLDAPAPDPRRPRVRDEVALLGWVYPGKGHGPAIDAVGSLPGPRPAVRALGAVSPGHAAEAAQLAQRARARGVDFAITGWLAEGDLLRRARAARVPLAAHDHVSASGSINLWVAAGRIPLVADSAYARELETLRPGTIRRYGAGELAGAIAGVLAGDETRRAVGVDTRPHLGDVAGRYVDWWSGL